MLLLWCGGRQNVCFTFHLKKSSSKWNSNVFSIVRSNYDLKFEIVVLYACCLLQIAMSKESWPVEFWRPDMNDPSIR